MAPRCNTHFHSKMCILKLSTYPVTTKCSYIHSLCSNSWQKILLYSKCCYLKYCYTECSVNIGKKRYNKRILLHTLLLFLGVDLPLESRSGDDDLAGHLYHVKVFNYICIGTWYVGHQYIRYKYGEMDKSY